MTQFETRSTSRRTAECNPIILRDGDQVRLVFAPTLVDNPANPKASVDGHFMYQRKVRSGRWMPVASVALSTLKAGEGFKLTLHAQELRTLLEGLVPLYRFYEQQGIPRGSTTFVQVDKRLASFVSLGERDLATLLESHSSDATTMLLEIVKWLATSPGCREAATRLAAMAPQQIPTFTALLGLAAVKDALSFWKQNQSNSTEEFWQGALADRAYVLSQVFAYPVVVIGQKHMSGASSLAREEGRRPIFWLSSSPRTQ